MMIRNLMLSFSIISILLVAGCNTSSNSIEIIISGDKELELSVGDTYTELGASVVDSYGKEYEPSIDGDVDTSKAGTYYVTYEVNFNGKNYSEKRKVIVTEPVLNEHELVVLKALLTLRPKMKDPDSVKFIEADDFDIEDQEWDFDFKISATNGFGASVTGVYRCKNALDFYSIAYDMTAGISIYEALSTYCSNKYNVENINYYLDLNKMPDEYDKFTNYSPTKSNEIGDTEYYVKEASTFGGYDYEAFYKTIQSGGNYISVGSSCSDDGDITDGNNGSTDGLIVKKDSEGNVLWHKTFGGSSHDTFYSVIEDQDGYYIAIGYSHSSDFNITDGNHGYADSLAVKFNSDGDVIWDKTIGGTGPDYFRDIAIDQDGNYVIVGETDSTDGDLENNQYRDVLDGDEGLLVKLDSEGNILNTKTYKDMGMKNLSFTSIIIKGDNDYVIAGYGSGQKGDTYIDSYASVHCIDSDNLNIKWNNGFESTYEDSTVERVKFNDLKEDANGDIVLVGYTNADGADITDSIYWDKEGLVIKIDSNGNKVWDRTFGGFFDDYFNSIAIDENGNYVIIGTTKSMGFDITDDYRGEEDALVFIIDEEGNYVNDITYGGTEYDEFYHGFINESGELVLSGSTSSNDYDLLLINFNFISRDALLVIME